MIELLSLIGSAGAGKAFGLVSEFLQSKERHKSEHEERQFRRELAAGDRLGEYMEALHGPPNNHGPSLLGSTLCVLYIMFGATVCTCSILCFYYGIWEHEAVSIKDPDQSSRTFSILGGAIKYEWPTKSISQISLVGIGYLLLHPILFILSTVTTGTPRKN